MFTIEKSYQWNFISDALVIRLNFHAQHHTGYICTMKGVSGSWITTGQHNGQSMTFRGNSALESRQLWLEWLDTRIGAYYPVPLRGGNNAIIR